MLARNAARIAGRAARSVRRRRRTLNESINGYRETCLIIAAIRLGVIEWFSRNDGTEQDMARDLGSDLPSLRRLLRGLRVIGLVEQGDENLRLTDRGRSLLSGDSRTGDLAFLVAQEYLPAWAELDKAVLSGEPAFEAAFHGDVWEHRATHPHINDAFNRLMTRWQGRAAMLLEETLDLTGVKVIVDVGAGSGAFLASLLKEHRGLSGVAFDQPHVLESTTRTLTEAGVRDRCEVVGGSFFERVPKGGDLYILRHIIHDWADKQAIQILRTCADAMRPSSRLLIVDAVMPESGSEPIDLVMRDLHMMAVTGGQERTKNEFEELLRGAMLEIQRTYSREGLDFVEARPASKTR